MENLREHTGMRISNPGAVDLLNHDAYELDRRLPNWARRTNPIVRRHLGVYWKAIVPEVMPLARLMLVQYALIALSLFIPFLLDLAMPMIIVSLFLLPVALYYYGVLLFRIGQNAAITMINEREHHTFALLRTTPLTIKQIIFSKVAASVWRRIEDLNMIFLAGVLLSLPVVIIHYATFWTLTEYAVFSRTGMIIGLTVSLVRLLLEPMMAGMIGIMAGASAPDKITALVFTGLTGAFYFGLLNLPRLMPLSQPMWIVVEIVLPLVLPLLVTATAFLIARHMLQRD